MAYHAAKAGQLEVVQWIDNTFGVKELYKDDGDEDWFVKAVESADFPLFLEAVKSGDVRVLNWLYERFPIQSDDVMFGFYWARKITTLDWLFARVPGTVWDDIDEEPVNLMVQNCPAPVMHWLEERVPDLFRNSFNNLLEGIEEYCRPGEDTARKIRYLVEHGMVLNRGQALTCFEWMESVEDFECLYSLYPQYLTPNASLWREVIMEGPRKRQHLEWLESKGPCPEEVLRDLNPNFLQGVLEHGGSLKLAQWLYSHNACIQIMARVTLGETKK